MFREMRRIKNKISEEDAKNLLANEKRGIFAVNGDDGYPYAIPVNYFYDRENEKIYFHGAKSGHKIDALKKDDKVCFTVYGNERYKEGDWEPYSQSTVVFGRCRLIEDAEITEARVRELALKYYPDKEEAEQELRKSIQAVQLYEITIEHLSGKQVHEK
ncbi:Predicted flavin-nucleotide-binding protein [Roseburia inulinivorans]|uniref:Predicted flavin-nucleotide-binding protein n=1 Tax=Roseburia inulinivorans TaxID=360807 RepID=A0A0M6WJR2_9FIRM|nr:pyridoxamine 5'-phosphate oxidase family protein [Roseburia inulinivorans]CRL37105.1 Predicted flavin-nucleotide-binding protein [Roseburia inulinivorans]